MAQHDYNIANDSGANVRADLNNVLAAIKTMNSGANAPSATSAGMSWFDTSDANTWYWKLRNNSDDGWINVGALDVATDVFQPMIDDDLLTTYLTDNFYTETELNNGQLDNRYYTETEINNKPTGFKNYIINGGFDVWQRGADLTISSGYSADRWLLQGAGDSVRFRKHNLTADMVNAWGAGQGALITTTTTTGSLRWQQRIEGLRKFSSKNVTVSFGMSAQVVGTYTIKLRCVFGSGGSSNLFIGLYTFNNASSYSIENITHTFSVPDLTSYTFGAGDYLQLEIYFGTDTLAFANNNIYLANVQLEEGSVATPFEQRPYGLELSLCQRYYQTDNINAGGANSYKYMGGSRTFSFNSANLFPVVMRDVPTIVIATPVYENCSTIRPSGLQNTGFTTAVNSLAGNYRAYSAIYTADAEL